MLDGTIFAYGAAVRGHRLCCSTGWGCRLPRGNRWSGIWAGSTGLRSACPAPGGCWPGNRYSRCATSRRWPGGLFDQLAIERTDVLGLSFGGMVAQQLAHDMPAQIRSLVLVSTSCGLGGDPSNPASWWNAMLADDWLTPYAWSPTELAHRWSQLMMREFGAGWATGPRLKGFLEQTWRRLLGAVCRGCHS